MNKNVKSTFVIIAVLFAILYTGDWLLIQIKLHKGQKPVDTIEVQSYDAIPEKNNKVEFFYNDPETEECVHALFPHFGDNPCWYAGRHQTHRTDL